MPQAAALYIWYLIKPVRKGWSAKQSITCALMKQFFHYSTTTQSRHVLDDVPEKAKERFVQIKPAASHLFAGVLASSPIVKPSPVKGVWIPALPPQDAAERGDEKISIHYPGGAFVMTFGDEIGGKPAFEVLKRLKSTRMLWARYRLASSEDTRFPAAVQDALTYYHYVLSLGYNPQNITVAGDSAGGNVALALLRYLESSKAPDLPLPGQVMLFSPWLHVTLKAGQDYERSASKHHDMLTGPLLQWGAEAYLPKGQVSVEAEPYVSPHHRPFKTSVPVFVYAGATEVLLPSIKSFADEMANTKGNRVRFHAMEHGPHDLIMGYDGFDMKNEIMACVDEAHQFFEESK